MQLTQKHIIGISVVAVLAILGYFAVQDTTPSQSDGVNISTGASSINTSTTTQTGSNTNWGPSPFVSGSSGSSYSGSTNSGVMVFQMPNTEWKTRTLSGITYVFGEGDPKEVQPKFENFQGWDTNGYIDSTTVRPKVEILLAQFLSNPMLVNVINKCGPLTTPGSTSSPLAMGLPWVLFTTDFSMERMITINPSTGQKELDIEKWGLFGIVFSEIRDYEYPSITKKRVNFLADQCLSGNEIADFDSLVEQYNTIQHSWYNGSSENRKEVCQFLELKECNPVSDQ